MKKKKNKKKTGFELFYKFIKNETLKCPNYINVQRLQVSF